MPHDRSLAKLFTRQGNVRAGSDGLPAVICKFVAFLLDTLSKEARESAKAAARDEAAKASAALAAVTRREREILSGVSSESTSGKPEKLSLDAMIAKRYAERLGQESGASKADADMADKAERPGKEGAGGGSAASAVGTRTIFDEVFGAVWGETFTFPGVREGAAPVLRELNSLVVPLKPPTEETEDKAAADAEGAGGSERAHGAATAADAAHKDSGREGSVQIGLEAGSFEEFMSHCIFSTTSTRAWCPEQGGRPGKYRAARHTKQMKACPRALCLTMAQLPDSTMQEWEQKHGGDAWLPESFHLCLPEPPASPPVRPSAPDTQESDAPLRPSSVASGGGASAVSEAATEKPRVYLDAPPTPPAGGSQPSRYCLRALISYSQTTIVDATEGSGHLILFFRVPAMPPPMPDVASGRADSDSAATTGSADSNGGAAACSDGAGPPSGDAESVASSVVQGMVDEVVAAAEAAKRKEAATSTPPPPTSSASEPTGPVPCSSPAAMAEHWENDGVWYAWNDFSLRPASSAEVRAAHTEWKRPCVALYSLDGLSSSLGPISEQLPNPVATASHLSTDFSLTTQAAPTSYGKGPTFTALSPRELPLRAGSLIAIDAVRAPMPTLIFPPPSALRVPSLDPSSFPPPTPCLDALRYRRSLWRSLTRSPVPAHVARTSSSSQLASPSRASLVYGATQDRWRACL